MDSGEQLGFQHAAPSAPFDFLFLALGTLSGRMSRLAIFRGQTDESAGATCGWCQAKDFCSIPKPRNLKPKTRNKEAQSEGTSPERWEPTAVPSAKDPFREDACPLTAQYLSEIYRDLKEICRGLEGTHRDLRGKTT